MRKRNPVRTETSGFRYQMRHRRRIANDAIRPAIGPDLSKLQVILPVQSAERRLFRAAFSFKSAASFSQQIPKVICERSCRMAKTLTVNIAQILKKESRKTKKNKKRSTFCSFFTKTASENVKRETGVYVVRNGTNPWADRSTDSMPRPFGKNLTFQGKRRIV